jgi:hypothetical protein
VIARSELITNEQERLALDKAALAQAGRCSEALATQRRALDLLFDDHPGTAEIQKRFLDRLRAYESGCAASPHQPRALQINRLIRLYRRH